MREEQRQEALRLSREEHHVEEEATPLPPALPPRVEEATPPPVVRAEEPRPVERQPRVDPKELLENDGLVMIETDRAKAPPAVVHAEEPQPLGRPRRERAPAPAQAQDEALVQVETSRK